MSVPTDHPFAFDPTYGFGIAELKAIRPPAAPSGFEVFWRARHAKALEVVPRPMLQPSRASHRDWVVYDVAFTSTEGFSIGGWLMVPAKGEIARGLVVGHGYGGREQPDFDLPVRNTVVLFPCFRGLSRSACPSISPDPVLHVLHGIDAPDSYVIGGCVEDLWVAVSVLISLYPELEGKVGYSGSSFGGGIGALAIPFDRRIDRGHLVVPTFGNRPLWLTLPTTGSGDSVQRYGRTHPGVLETLALFDAAVAASLIEVPMLVAVALFDPAVAPPCQFSVANALPEAKFNENFILDAGHFDYPDAAKQHAVLTERIRQFFGVT